MLRVLMVTRQNYLEIPGGDTIQLLQTKAHLGKMGVQVDVSNCLEFEQSSYDVIHLFNLTEARQTYVQVNHALQAKKPLFLSTIYWDKAEYLSRGFTAHCSWGRKLKVKALQLLNRVSSDNENLVVLQREILNHCNHLLPNAHVEMEVLQNNFGLSKEYSVIPNGVDLSFSEGKPDWFVREYGLRDFILCVGRIEVRKNQLGLIKALQGTGVPLVLIGKSTSKGYFAECKRVADKNVHFIPHLSQDILKSAYAAARVHVLPSWYETPGLATLEAGLAGCNLVSTNRGSAREYFGKMIRYCDPDSQESIREACLAAFHSEVDHHLSKYIEENFSWRQAAITTLEAYQKFM